MKKIKHLILAIILILILFPTCVQAATEDEVTKAIFSTVQGIGTIKEDRTVDSIEAEYFYEGYTTEGGMSFTNSSFLSFIYHNVFGFDMTKETSDGWKNVWGGGDFCNDFDNNSKYFLKEKISNGVNLSRGDEAAKKALKELRPGDLAVKYGGLLVPKDNYQYMIYVGNNQFMLFDNNTQTTMPLDASSMKYDVALIQLKNYDSLDIKNSSFSPKTTTIDNELGKLNLGAKFVDSNGNPGVMFNTKIAQIKQAFARGLISEFGNYQFPSFEIVYKTQSGEYINIDNRAIVEPGLVTTTISRDPFILTGFGDKQDITEFKDNPLESDWYNYFTSDGDKTLYLKIYFAKEVFYYDILNGKVVNSEMEAFSNGILANDKLSSFTGISPSDIIDLISDQADIRKINIDSEQSEETVSNCGTEILFTVKETGYYNVKGDSISRR